MELHKLISDVLNGKPRVLSFDNVAFGLDNPTADVLSALNFVRIAFAAAGNSPLLSQLLESLCSRQTVQNALAICREWHGGLHMEAEDVYHVPLFEASLKLVSSDHDYDFPSLRNLCPTGSSAAVLITHYPHVVACLRLQASFQEIFLLFDPRGVSPKHEQVVSLTLCSSIPQIEQRLCDMFSLDRTRLSKAPFDRQARSPAKCGRLVFVPRADCAQEGEECLILSSLTLLNMKGELEELTRDNERLKQEKLRLKKSIVDLAARLEEEMDRNSRAQSFRSSVAKVLHHAPPVPGRGPSTRPSLSTKELQYFAGGDKEMDPDIQFALQLQASFDSENDTLLRQKHDLLQTSQRQYHCGVCLDDFPEDDAVHIDACGHEICRECARGHVCSKIEEHRFPVLCPVCMADNKNQNPGTIPGTLVQLLGISEEQWATWVEMEIAQFSISITCRKCQHSGFVDRADLEAHSEIHCPFSGCNHVWCQKCQQTIEPGGPEHSCDGTTELDHLVKQKGWRYCPNCKTPIQKILGCNHLSCIAPGCNTHFCYRCGKMINRTGIPHEILNAKMEHYRTCSLME